MGTIIITFILIAIIVLALSSVKERILHGSSCCGERDAPTAKVRVHDKNKSHYPYTYELTVDGMHCSNCTRHVENALNIPLYRYIGGANAHVLLVPMMKKL